MSAEAVWHICTIHKIQTKHIEMRHRGRCGSLTEQGNGDMRDRVDLRRVNRFLSSGLFLVLDACGSYCMLLGMLGYSSEIDFLRLLLDYYFTFLYFYYQFMDSKILSGLSFLPVTDAFIV